MLSRTLGASMGRGKAIDAFGARSRLKEAVRPAPAPKGRDTTDERADKAEKYAQIQHSTSLLSGETPASPVRATMTVQRGAAVAGEKSGGMPFALQVLFVMALAGGA